MAHRLATVMAIIMTFWAFASHSQTRSYHVYIDTDNDIATGCTADYPAIPATINGVESRLTITTDSATPPNITDTRVHQCNAGTFDAGTSTGASALGFNTGTNAGDVFEARVSLSQLNIGTSRSIRLYYATESAASTDVVLTQGNGGPIVYGFPVAIPTLSIFGLLLLVLLFVLISRKRLAKHYTLSLVLVGVATIAVAMDIIIDGQTNDWMNMGPANTDPVGDNSGTGSYADLTAVFFAVRNDSLFVRTDVVDVENQPPTITTAATVSVQENQTAVIDVNSTDPEGDVEGAGLSYSITGSVDDALFTIDANTGVLTFISAPDYEAPSDVGADNVYNVQVTVTDSGAATDVQDLAVTVTNDVVDDTAVSFQTVSSATTDEGTVLNVVVELTASAPLTAAVSVDVVDAGGGSATAGADYNNVGTQTLTFPMGSTDGTTLNAVLAPIDDNNVEDNESVNLQLQNISGPALIGSQTSHVVTITEDDLATVVFDTAASATSNENMPLDVAVRLDIPSGGQLDVAITADVIDAGTGTATSGVDYQAFGTQTVTFAIGANNGAIQNTTLTPIDDPNSKGNETVDLTLQNLTGPTTASLGAQTSHVVTITDDEVSVFFQASNSSTADESTALNVVVELSTPIPLTAPVSVDVVDAGTGTATSGTDYNAFGTQTLVFPIGSTNGTTMNAVLTPVDDINVENNEIVDLNLQNLVGTGSIGTQSTHNAIISEDDTATVSFQAASSATANESSSLNINVLLSIPSGGQLDIAVATEVVDAGGGSASSGVDYNAFGIQAINFPVGSGDGTTQASTLTPIDDSVSEGNETVNLSLQNLAGPPLIVTFAAPTTHTATITDDEASVAFQATSSSTVDEGTALNIPVVLSTPIPLSAALSVDVVDAGGGSAANGADYTAVGTQTLTFPMGSTNGATLNAVLSPLDDNNVENNETVNLALQNLVGTGSIGTQSSHTVTITENDTATVAFQAASSATVDESTALDIAVLLNIPSGGQLDIAITVDAIDAGGGTASSGVDYTAFGTQMVTFPVGAMNGATQNTTLTPLDDVATEGDETVNLQLQNLAGPLLASLGAQTTHAATISDDDNTPPTANNDSYETVGNTGLHATAGVASTPIRHPDNVIANDTDPQLDTLTVTEAVGDLTAPFTGTSTLGGDVVMQANGDFTYYPPVGVTSMVDTFDYTISDGMFTSSATVSITITADLVYYVDNTAAAGGNGRDNSRFDQLSDVPTADNTTVYVFQGTGNTTGDITLGVNQVLLGNGVNLEFNVNNTLPNPDVLFASAGRPTLTGTTTLGTNNTIRGLNIGDTGAQTGIVGTTFGTLTANTVAINGTGKAVDLVAGTAAITFDSITSTNSASEGIDLENVSGNFTVTGATNITSPTQIGLYIQNSNLVYTFGDVTVNNRNSAGVFINGFTGGIQTGTFGNITINNQNNSATSAMGIDNIVAGGSTINIASVAIDNNGANSSAIALSNNDGATITISGGNVQNAAGAAVSITNSLGSATYAGNINNTAGRSVQVLTNGGGITTFSGNITDSGTGIFLNNNTGSTTNFSGTLDLDTTTNTAFSAITGGTLNITGSSNTIDTTSGTALEVIQTDIGGGNLNFQSISAGTGAGTPGIAIDLWNTGNVGGLIVTGTASIAGSGGTIQNKTGSDNSSTDGIGILLTNTQHVSLSNMQLNGFDNFAIQGDIVTNFSLIDSVINGISGNSAAFDEGAISFTNLSGNVLFSGINVSGGFENQIKIVNNTGVATITVNDSANDQAVIGLDANPAGLNGNDGLLVESQNSAQINLTVDGVDFLGARGDMLQTNVLNNSSFTSLIQNNNFNNTHPNIVSGGGGITLSGGGAGANITKGYDVLNSVFSAADGNATTVNFVSGAGTVSGEVSNNVIGINGVPGSGSANANGISLGASQNVQHNTTANGNQIWGIDGFAGIETIANTDVDFNATITSNTVQQLGGFAFAAMYNMVGGVGTETGTACLDVRGNTFDASGAPFAGNAVFKDQISGAANYNLPGYGGSASGEFAFACAPGTASVDASVHHTGNGNTMTNGPSASFPAIGVDASIVCGKTGTGTFCPQ